MELNPDLKGAIHNFIQQNNKFDVLQLHRKIEGLMECTYIDIKVNKIKVGAILDTGAPSNIVSTKLAKTIKLAQDLEFKEEFGTAGPYPIKAKGAYSSLFLRFRKLVITAPAVILENQNYDILIGTEFMNKYGTVTDHHRHTFSILGNTVPIYYSSGTTKESTTKKVYYVNM